MTPPPDSRAALRGRVVVLGVTGGIAAYKAVDVCRQLVDADAHVAPVLTTDAQRFIGALTFSALASEPARSQLFSGGYGFNACLDLAERSGGEYLGLYDLSQGAILAGVERSLRGR